MNFDQCIHLHSHHPDQDTEHLRHSRKYAPLVYNCKNLKWIGITSEKCLIINFFR